MEQNFSPFLSANRKSFSTDHVLNRLLEDWSNKLDNKNVVGAVLTDLSKTFDCIPHDLLVAKLDEYGFNRNTVAYLYSYLKNRKQYIRINGTQSYLGDIISGVPRINTRSHFTNLFFNDFFYFILLAKHSCLL